MFLRKTGSAREYWHSRIFNHYSRLYLNALSKKFKGLVMLEKPYWNEHCHGERSPDVSACFSIPDEATTTFVIATMKKARQYMIDCSKLASMHNSITNVELDMSGKQTIMGEECGVHFNCPRPRSSRDVSNASELWEWHATTEEYESKGFEYAPLDDLALKIGAAKNRYIHTRFDIIFPELKNY